MCNQKVSYICATKRFRVMIRDEFKDKIIELIKQPRMFIPEQIKDLTDQQLNKIPPAFNNNIIWNVAHLIWAQQEVCYQRFGLQITVDDNYFSPYKTGTKPGTIIDENEIMYIKHLLITTTDKLVADLENNVLVIDNAIIGLPLHDWLHAGYIMALKRLVK